VLDGLGKVAGNGAAHDLDSRQRKDNSKCARFCSVLLHFPDFGAVRPMNINL
jgi:hypothetical protein